jgi:hypothetical protein
MKTSKYFKRFATYAKLNIDNLRLATASCRDMDDASDSSADMAMSASTEDKETTEAESDDSSNDSVHTD